jgi:hypothetical protein
MRSDSEFSFLGSVIIIGIFLCILFVGECNRAGRRLDYEDQYDRCVSSPNPDFLICTDEDLEEPMICNVRRSNECSPQSIFPEEALSEPSHHYY